MCTALHLRHSANRQLPVAQALRVRHQTMGGHFCSVAGSTFPSITPCRSVRHSSIICSLDSGTSLLKPMPIRTASVTQQALSSTSVIRNNAEGRVFCLGSVLLH